MKVLRTQEFPLPVPRRIRYSTVTTSRTTDESIAATRPADSCLLYKRQRPWPINTPRWSAFECRSTFLGGRNSSDVSRRAPPSLASSGEGGYGARLADGCWAHGHASYGWWVESTAVHFWRPCRRSGSADDNGEHRRSGRSRRLQHHGHTKWLFGGSTDNPAGQQPSTRRLRRLRERRAHNRLW